MSLLPMIRVPTLVAHGGGDRLIHPDCAVDIASRIPSARVHIFPAKGHLPMFSAAEGFCELLASFARE